MAAKGCECALCFMATTDSHMATTAALKQVLCGTHQQLRPSACCGQVHLAEHPAWVITDCIPEQGEAIAGKGLQNRRSGQHCCAIGAQGGQT